MGVKMIIEEDMIEVYLLYDLKMMMVKIYLYFGFVIDL